MSDPRPDARAELGTFLRSRRTRLDRAALGLPPGGRGRRTGLRREEVAVHAGVSVTWYTWLEQGRDINPSRQVLDAVARALRLSAAEHGYVLSLLGFAAPREAPAPDGGPAPAHLQRLLDALGDNPAFALAADWRIAGWNRAYEEMVPRVAELEPVQRNLLRVIFTEPSVRALLDDWEVTSRRFLAQFRAESGHRLGEPDLRALVDDLQTVSPEFAAAWADHDVETFASRERVFHHPTRGRLVLEHHQLRPADVPDLQLVIYTPIG